MFKISILLIQLQDHINAIKYLEMIPAEHRDLKVKMQMGRLFLSTNMKTQAISTFKSVLSTYPLALEAIEYLIDLGVQTSDIVNLGVNQKQNTLLVEGYLCTCFFFLL